MYLQFTQMARLNYCFGEKRKALAPGIYPYVTLQQTKAQLDTAKKLISDATDFLERKKENKATKVQSFEPACCDWLVSSVHSVTDTIQQKKIILFDLHIFPAIGATLNRKKKRYTANYFNQSKLEKPKIININALITLSFIGLFFSATGCAIDSNSCISAAPTSSHVVNVKEKGAKGDGITDDTAAIQAAVDQVGGTGGTVLVPDGTYIINAITSIKIKSDMTFRMSKGTVLKALPNGKTNYSIINITDASNVNVIDGTLIGERDEHTGTSGEWGMGITLRGATNAVVEGVMAKNCWGDGFYISGNSKNVKFCSVIADNNRRQGMSIISVDGIVVKNSIFENTGGTPPQAGIDIEPNEKDAINDVKILNSQFIANKGLGIQLYQGANRSLINDVTIDGNSIKGNLAGGIAVNKTTTGHKIINNLLKDNKGYGIHLLKGAAKGNTVTGNTVPRENGIKDEEGGNSVFDNGSD